MINYESTTNFGICQSAHPTPKSWVVLAIIFGFLLRCIAKKQLYEKGGQ